VILQSWKTTLPVGWKPCSTNKPALPELYQNLPLLVIAPSENLDRLFASAPIRFLKYIIEPAAKEFGFTALRADAISVPRMITSQVIQHIIEDAMVVADLTDYNANVFDEPAIRHAIRRPYVQIIDEKDPLPFDVAGIRTIQFTHTDLDSVGLAQGWNN
jgi:hypothetical protein